jgi:hypothetical protein
MRTGIYVNGVQIIENFSIYSLNSNLYGGGAAISAVYTLSAGDYIEHYAWLNGTSPFIYAGSWFSAFKLVE